MGHVELLIDWREEVPVINIAIGCTEKSTPKCDVPGKSKSEADLGQLRLALGLYTLQLEVPVSQVPYRLPRSSCSSVCSWQGTPWESF